MDKCTQNSAEIVINEVISTLLSNVNTAICFYQKRPTFNSRLSLEETLIENIPFAIIAANYSSQGQYLLEQLKHLNDSIIHRLPIVEIELTELVSSYER